MVWIIIREDESMDLRSSRRDMAGVGVQWREDLYNINMGIQVGNPQKLKKND